MEVNRTEVFAPVVTVAPYGGVRCSGIGREGPKYAIEKMTEERMMIFLS